MFSSLGLEIHITELDLTVYIAYHGEGAKNQVKETRAWVTFWGLADTYTWLHNFPVPNRTDYPFVFDNELNAKQSFWDIVSS